MESAEGATTTLRLKQGVTQEGSGRSYSLLALLVVIYSSLIISLLTLRVRRVTESLTYLR
jgi:hypothetical protein